MKDWAKPMLTLEDHAKSIGAILSLCGASPEIAPDKALEVEAHLDAIVGCCNEIDAWVADHTNA